MPRVSGNSDEILQAALIGFQYMRDQVDQKIAELRSQIGAQSPSGAGQGESAAGKRTMSEAARRRIAQAQKKRWAAYKAQHPGARGAKPAKRVLSPEGRARIIAATKKRWAAFRKAKQAKQPDKG